MWECKEKQLSVVLVYKGFQFKGLLKFFTPFTFTVVWNPWEKKSKTMVDLGDEEYKQMLCVDGAVIEKPITLKPGEEWTGRLELSAVPSTYCCDHLDGH